MNALQCPVESMMVLFAFDEGHKNGEGTHNNATLVI